MNLTLPFTQNISSFLHSKKQGFNHNYQLNWWFIFAKATHIEKDSLRVLFYMCKKFHTILNVLFHTHLANL